MSLKIVIILISHIFFWEQQKNSYLCRPKSGKNIGAIAQLVEQRTENPCVPSSILGGTTKEQQRTTKKKRLFFF